MLKYFAIFVTRFLKYTAGEEEPLNMCVLRLLSCVCVLQGSEAEVCVGAAVSGGRGGQDGPAALCPPGHGALGQAGEIGRGSRESRLLTHRTPSPPEGV